MFVRFRRSISRLQVSLVEPRRISGKVKQEHVAGLGSIECEPMTIAGRVAFWQELYPHLDKLDNRIGAGKIKILAAIHARIPVVTVDEIRELQRQNAEADVKVWQAFEDLADAEGKKELAAPAAQAEEQAKVAAKNVAGAKDHLDKIAKGETLTGGLGKPLDMVKILKDAGWTESELQYLRDFHEFCELLGGGDKAAIKWFCEQRGKVGDRWERATVRRILRQVRE